MKKNYIILFVCMFCSVFSLNAQKVTKGSFKDLANERRIKFELDYSESTIDGYLFEDFLRTEKEWNQGYEEITAKFIKEANKELKGSLILSPNADSEYKLVVKAKSVDRDGETRASLYLVNGSGEVIAVADKLNGDGGRYGSQMNLMGDASERMGKQVGKFLKKQIK